MNRSDANTPFGDALDQVLGYMNFSSGNEDFQFLANMNRIFETLGGQDGDPSELVLDRFGHLLGQRLEDIPNENGAFRNVEQARTVQLVATKMLIKKYFEFHSDLLAHQDQNDMFNSFLVGRFFEAALAQGGPWDEHDRIVSGALEQLNCFIGHRPLAVLESHECQAYPHEWVRPVPVYVRNVGAVEGKYYSLVSKAIELLKSADPAICQNAQFDFEKLDELAYDPRAFDFDHPANRRPNYQFGQWDEHLIDESGFYRRFVVNRLTLDSLLARIDEETAHSREELVFEAAAVFAGTILMASGICGRGPGAFDSETSLTGLMPLVARYRDHFYEDLLSRLKGDHQKRLLQESKERGQAFAAARQDINSRLSQKRAQQLVHVRLASIFARMGYIDAAYQQASIVSVTSTRLICQIDCLLSTSQQLVTKGEFVDAVENIPKIFNLILRGIQCGAIVDPWNILGFDGNYDLFHGTENTIRDHRIDDLVEIVEQTTSLCSQIWSEAAAVDDTKTCDSIQRHFRKIVDWWNQYAPHEVAAVEAINPVEVFEASEHVARALNLWHRGGASAGDIEFWSNHAEMFDSPQAYALVIDALMQRDDTKTPMALMIHWLNNADRLPLEEGESSIHDLVDRWIVEQAKRLGQKDRSWQSKNHIWNQIRKFYDFVEANADYYWSVPEFILGKEVHDEVNQPEDSSENGESENDDDEEQAIYDAAYENVIYQDTTDDGFEGEIYETGSHSEDELEEEVERVTDRLEFLATIANFWKQVSRISLNDIQRDADDQSDLKTLANHCIMIQSWVEQADSNLAKLAQLLSSVNQYQLPVPTGDHDSLLIYDRFRLFKEALLSRIIAASVETEDSIRSMLAVVGAIKYLQEEKPLDENAGSTLEQKCMIAVFAAIVLREPVLIRQYMPALIDELHGMPLLYVPLSKSGEPEDIVTSRLRQSAINELLAFLPIFGLIPEMYELTNTALAMERNHPLGPGAVTEFDELFRTAYTSTVRALIYASAQPDPRSAQEDLEAGIDAGDSHDHVLFECMEMLTESMLIMWLEHSQTLRLSVLEKVAENSTWDHLKEFVQTFGEDLFTQQFLHLGNIRAILHQGVDQWFAQLEQHQVDNIELILQLNVGIQRKTAVNWLTLILEAVIENYHEYRDYNGTTTQSDRGELFYIFLDFLRLRVRYDRVCWHLKPVVWAHEHMVREQEVNVAKLWRRSLSERVGPEAKKYWDRLVALQEKYSVQMSTVADRLAERFVHPMHVDRMRALVGPAMLDPHGSESNGAFEMLQHDAESLCKRPLGAGLEIPSWLAALETEVKICQMPEHVRQSDTSQLIDPQVKSISELQEQLETLPRRQS